MSRETISEEIKSGNYTCLVCTDPVSATAPVWACPECTRVFDLDCIKDWSTNGTSTSTDDKSWRCPACNLTITQIPKIYTCWCGKSINPNPNLLDPHSCGSICDYPLKNCQHGCSLPCHPGTHAEKCTSLGPKLKCKCGKHEKQWPCILTPYDDGWKCDDICNDILPCGLHKCNKICHEGLCGDCHKLLDVKCYCGKVEDSIPCNERLPKLSANGLIGNFQCSNECNEYLDCGIHKCTMGCHPLSKDSHKCPDAPQNRIYCPCGKVKINDILETPRTSCLDPIPVCDLVCGKKLPCGHKCYWKCHTGECAPCYQPVEKDCRCEFTHYTIACALNVEGYVPVCQTKCNATFNCRRHFCVEKCCPYRKLALERTKVIKKQLRNNIISTRHLDNLELEDVHTCHKECGHYLSCGLHRCKEACHSGPCKPCLESSSEDLICHCGNTIVPAPVRCGTKLPLCPFQCDRAKSCGHRPEPHNCHGDDIECPKCTFLMTKKCQCEKGNLVANVFCYQDKVSCYKPCDKLLLCGVHKCKKICHPEGECTKKCTEKCLKIKSCGHECQQVCHTGKPCNEELPCQDMVTILCDCGRKSQKIHCYILRKMINESPDPNYKPHFDCDEVCEKEIRNKKLFEALGLDPVKAKETETSLKMRKIEVLYTPFIVNLYSKQQVWCSSIEKIFKDLLSHTMDSSFISLNNSQIKQAHNFKPMKQVQRRFVHELANSWGLFSESHDPEPKRSVFVKLVKNAKIPEIELREALEVFNNYKSLEKKKAEERESRRELEYVDIKQDKINFWNGIVIKDVFFGVTTEAMDAGVFDLWNVTNEETGEREFSLINHAKVEYINETMYVFYGDDVNNDAKLAQQEQYLKLNELFNVRVKNKNLALKCVLAKVDVDKNIVLEIDRETSKETAKQETVNKDIDEVSEKLLELENLKIESTTVAPDSDWW